MTNEDSAYLKEMFNKEITKLRREIWDLNQSYLIEFFCPNDIERAWLYFNAIPIMDSLNVKSIEMLIECCQIAKEYRESKDK